MDDPEVERSEKEMPNPWTGCLLVGVACLGIAYVSNASVTEESAHETRAPVAEIGITEVEVDIGGNDTVLKEIAVGFSHSRLSTPLSCKSLCADNSWVAINAGNTGRSLCRSKLSKYYYGRSICDRSFSCSVN